MATFTTVQICNKALVLCGASPIVALTDDTPNARALSAVYEISRRSILTECRWTFSLTRSTLATASTTSLGFTYPEESNVYTRPTDALRIWQMSDIEAVWREEGPYIISNTASLGTLYTFDHSEVGLWRHKFVEAFIDKLCSDICFMILQSSPKAEAFLSKYEKITLPKAMAEDSQTGLHQEIIDNEWLASKYHNGGIPQGHMADPSKLFESRDMEGAILYVKRVTGDNEAWPLLAASDGSLYVTITAGTISVNTAGLATSVGQTTSNIALQAIQTAVTGQLTIGTVTLNTTAVTVTNAIGTPVNVSLTNTAVTASLSSTKVTVESTGLNVTLTSTVVTVKSAVAGFNVNVATATLGTVTVSLSSTEVTVKSAVAGFNVNVATATLGTVTVSLSSTAVTASLSSTMVTVSAISTSVSTIMLNSKTLTATNVSLNATSGTLIGAGSNRLKIYAVSVTTTATTSSLLTFINGTYGGMTLWKAAIIAPSGAMAGFNLAVTPPAFLFATGSGQLLRLNLTNAIPVEVSLSYFDEA